MSKHTPGPWHQVGQWVEVEDDNIADICSCDTASIGQEHLGRSQEEMVANARLIASAPDLLSALVGMVKNTYERTQDEEFFEAARAAIAKATGKV